MRKELGACVTDFLTTLIEEHAVEGTPMYETPTTGIFHYISPTFPLQPRPYVVKIKNGVDTSDKKALRKLSLTAEHEKKIRRTLVSAPKLEANPISPVFVSLAFSDSRHANVFIFDASGQDFARQYYFDPDSSCSDPANRYIANIAGKVKGVFPAVPETGAPEDSDESIQSVMDDNHYSISGNCAIYAVLMSVLCVRFGVGEPKLMTDVIIKSLRDIDKVNKLDKNKAVAGSHMTVIWSWVDSILAKILVIRSNPELAAG
ncbi:unnamed protein product [Pylaiella littoralis]